MDRRKFIGAMASGAVAVPALGLSESFGIEKPEQMPFASPTIVKSQLGSSDFPEVVMAMDTQAGMRYLFRLKLYIYNGLNNCFTREALRGLESCVCRIPTYWHPNYPMSEIDGVISQISFVNDGLYAYGSIAGNKKESEMLASSILEGDTFLAAGYTQSAKQLPSSQPVERFQGQYVLRAAEFTNRFVFLKRREYRYPRLVDFDWLNCKWEKQV